MMLHICIMKDIYACNRTELCTYLIPKKVKRSNDSILLYYENNSEMHE